MKKIKAALLALMMVGALGTNAAFADGGTEEDHCVDDSHWMHCDENTYPPGMGPGPSDGIRSPSDGKRPRPL